MFWGESFQFGFDGPSLCIRPCLQSPQPAGKSSSLLHIQSTWVSPFPAAAVQPSPPSCHIGFSPGLTLLLIYISVRHCLSLRPLPLPLLTPRSERCVSSRRLTLPPALPSPYVCVCLLRVRYWSVSSLRPMPTSCHLSLPSVCTSTS